MVKKHARANPGKSLKEILPLAKVEYRKTHKVGDHKKKGKKASTKLALLYSKIKNQKISQLITILITIISILIVGGFFTLSFIFRIDI